VLHQRHVVIGVQELRAMVLLDVNWLLAVFLQLFLFEHLHLHAERGRKAPPRTLPRRILALHQVKELGDWKGPACALNVSGDRWILW
jgi:hypothetical protein